MNAKIYIEPLSYETLYKALYLINEVFPEQPFFERANWAFRASLNQNLIIKLFFYILKVKNIQYWVFLNENKELIGVTGLYSYRHEPETCWVGWTAVEHKHRGQGIGKKLIDFVIQQARLEKKQFLRLHTTNHPYKLIAHSLYQSKNFKIIQEKRIKTSNFFKIYFELRL